MRLIVEEGYGPAVNMARDEAFFRAFTGAGGEPVWRVYTWDRPAVTFGRLQPYPGYGAGFPVIRRLTGGGLVPHGADLTYCVVQERLRGADNYDSIIEVVVGALRSLGIDCDIWTDKARGAAGRCFVSLAPFDIHVGGRKVAGCAQYRTRAAVMHHGSIANGAPAEEFVSSGIWNPRSAVSVEEITGKRLAADELSEAVKRAFRRDGVEIKRGNLSYMESDIADGVLEKYLSDCWNREAVWERRGLE